MEEIYFDIHCRVWLLLVASSKFDLCWEEEASNNCILLKMHTEWWHFPQAQYIPPIKHEDRGQENCTFCVLITLGRDNHDCFPSYSKDLPRKYGNGGRQIIAHFALFSSIDGIHQCDQEAYYPILTSKCMHQQSNYAIGNPLNKMLSTNTF